ncbi:YcgL domain-containing protein [Marinospirillum insulare]|uniref:YcgL domain-containing protein GCM10007878_03330 n=1 Tax=Marinospirillum insulare TaxID=217169 RepID=A0ABQ5ZY31_9GAMM|nr:YcgL domain-containing protein [Marinospirillum insulare]GLR62898.1 YcgL domain-containing protein [Marinospirillum insulare]
MKIITEVYLSSLKDEMYLYIDKKRGLKAVPEELMTIFGKPKPVFTILMTPNKKLARVEGSKVFNQLKVQGFYLQMPPPRDEYLLDLYKAPTEARY